MSIEAKEGISRIVRTALEPHYKKPAGITKEQYSNINRVVSHMLYEKIPDPGALDENEKSIWEKIASAEVTKAVESLGAWHNDRREVMIGGVLGIIGVLDLYTHWEDA
jgi:hypothetical protein